MTRTAAHPIGGAVARLHSVLDEVAEAPVWSLDQSGTAETLEQIARFEARVVELRSRVLAHADVVAVKETNASPSLAVWHANATRSTKRSSAPGRGPDQAVLHLLSAPVPDRAGRWVHR